MLEEAKVTSELRVKELEDKLAVQMRNSAFVWKAGNKVAQDALLREFPEVGAQFKIEEKGKRGALSALQQLRSSSATAAASGSGAAAFQK